MGSTLFNRRISRARVVAAEIHARLEERVVSGHGGEAAQQRRAGALLGQLRPAGWSMARLL